MEAGLIHGIEDGNEFSLMQRSTSGSRTQHLGMFASQRTTAFSTELTTLTGSTLLPKDETAFAIPRQYTTTPPFRVCFEKKAILLTIQIDLYRCMSYRHFGRPIQLLQRECPADTSSGDLYVDLSSDHARLVFSFWHSAIPISNGFHTLPHTLNICEQGLIDQLHSVIQSAAQFFWHLNRHPEDLLCGAPKLDIIPSFRRLDRRNRQTFWRPVDENILGPSNCVTLAPLDPEVRYGLGFENRTSVPLYASVFYFDCSDFSIGEIKVCIISLGTDLQQLAPIYLPNYPKPVQSDMQRQTDFSLQAKGGALTLGWGDSRVLPMTFSIPENLESDMGFFKTFVSTAWVDLSSVAQSTSFEGGHRAVRPDSDYLLPPAVWDAILITVVQRRHV